MSSRRYERHQLISKANWDFFTAGTGSKMGYITNISEGGCLLKTAEVIDHRRWIRLVIKDEAANMWITSVGRVIRCEHALEHVSPLNPVDGDFTLYRYGVEFIQQSPAVQDFTLTLAESSKNLTVRSCRSLNVKSS